MHYLTFPIELLRNYMAEPGSIFNAARWCIVREIDENRLVPYISKKNVEDVLKSYEENDMYFDCGFRDFPKNAKILVELNKNYPVQEKHCCVSIKRDMIIGAGKDDLREWDKVKFLGYCALKSIEGASNGVSKANNKLMWARMAGYPSWADLEKSETIGTCGLQGYFTEYYANKLRAELQMTFHNVKIYSKHTRGFYFTTKPNVSMENVIEYAIRASPSFKKKRLKQNTDAAEKRVKALLGI